MAVEPATPNELQDVWQYAQMVEDYRTHELANGDCWNDMKRTIMRLGTAFGETWYIRQCLRWERERKRGIMAIGDRREGRGA